MSQHGFNFSSDHKLDLIAIKGCGKINPHTKQVQLKMGTEHHLLEQTPHS